MTEPKTLTPRQARAIAVRLAQANEAVQEAKYALLQAEAEKQKIDKARNEAIFALRNSMSTRQIGELFDMTPNAVSRILARMFTARQMGAPVEQWTRPKSLRADPKS